MRGPTTESNSFFRRLSTCHILGALVGIFRKLEANLTAFRSFACVRSTWVAYQASLYSLHIPFHK